MDRLLQTAPFFIVGSARSGTTLLRLMLNEHTRLRVPPESHFIPTLMDHFPTGRALGKEDRLVAYDLIVKSPWWHHWRISDEDLHNAVLSPEITTLASLVERIHLDLGNPDKKARWGDKTPWYVREIYRLADLFPTSQFVHVIRDGRDVCLSLKQQRWWGRHMLKWAYYWDKTVHIGRAQGGRLGPLRYTEVTYEDLVLETPPTLRRICGFLGEEYEEGMLHFYDHARDELGASQVRTYHEKTTRPPRQADVGRWRKEMTVTDLITVEIIAGDGLDMTGYDRHFPRLRWLSKVVGFLRNGLGPIMLPLRDRVLKRFPKLRPYI